MTITIKNNPNKPEELNQILCEPVRKWFFSKFESYSPAQLFGVYEIHCRNNTLICAPTGSSKTLTAFLSILNELVDLAIKGLLEDRTYAIYISPLKALNYDIEYNLKTPLEEIEKIIGKQLGIRIGTRTADTTPYQRAKMAKIAPHILITTPESFALILASKTWHPHITRTDWFIVDEIHALAENKRGVQLSLLLEMFSTINKTCARIGLSATVHPAQKVAAYLCGNTRNCTIIQIAASKQLDLQVLSPVDDFSSATYNEIADNTLTLLHNLIQSHTTTLVFTNTRALTEKMVFSLKEKFPEAYYEISETPPFAKSQLIGAHHGSLAVTHRKTMEEKLRAGKMKCIVCSTSLELGIDIGYVDLVVHLSSPKSVTKLLQRVGRSGHKLNAISRGKIIAQHIDELIECCIIARNAKNSILEEIHIPVNCLDILCQWIVGMTLVKDWEVKELYEITTKSYNYKHLSYKDFQSCVFALSSDAFTTANIYPRIEIKNGKISAKKSTREIYTSNVGTISDSGSITVKKNAYSIGSIDEDFAQLLKPGDVFILGGETYKVIRFLGMTVQVTDSGNRLPTVPRWRSQSLALPKELARQIDMFRETINNHLRQNNEGVNSSATQNLITEYLQCDQLISKMIENYSQMQYKYAGIPSQQKMMIETHSDRSTTFIIIHSMYGKKVNEALAQLIEYVARVNLHIHTRTAATDNGFYVACERQIDARQLIAQLKIANMQQVTANAIEESELIKRKFRQCAVRSLFIIKRFRSTIKHVGKQQMASFFLYHAVKKIDPEFVAFKEATREIIEDTLDYRKAHIIIDDIAEKRVTIEYVQTNIPSPFAISLMVQAYADVLSPSERQSYVCTVHSLIQKLNSAGKKQKPETVQFEYDAFWRDEEKKTTKQKKTEQEHLLEDMTIAIRNSKFDANNSRLLLQLLDESITQYPDDFLVWLTKHLHTTIPEFWSDRLVHYLRIRLETLK